jgi:hypothetical protein
MDLEREKVREIKVESENERSRKLKSEKKVRRRELEGRE